MTYTPGLNNEALVSQGQFATTVPAATAGVIIKPAPGRLCRVFPQANMGATALTFYDNAAGTATGAIIGIIPTTATTGQVFDFEMSANVGISAVGGAGQVACTVTWI